MRFKNQGAKCFIQEITENMHPEIYDFFTSIQKPIPWILEDVEADIPFLGFGKLLLEDVKNFAKKQNKIIVCFPAPYGKKGFQDFESLENWYMRHGFEPVENLGCLVYNLF